MPPGLMSGRITASQGLKGPNLARCHCDLHGAAVNCVTTFRLYPTSTRSTPGAGRHRRGARSLGLAHLFRGSSPGSTYSRLIGPAAVTCVTYSPDFAQWK